MKMLRLLWLAVMMALACGKDASGPVPPPPPPPAPTIVKLIMAPDTGFWRGGALRLSSLVQGAINSAGDIVAAPAVTWTIPVGFVRQGDSVLATREARGALLASFGGAVNEPVITTSLDDLSARGTWSAEFRCYDAPDYMRNVETPPIGIDSTIVTISDGFLNYSDTHWGAGNFKGVIAAVIQQVVFWKDKAVTSVGGLTTIVTTQVVGALALGSNAGPWMQRLSDTPLAYRIDPPGVCSSDWHGGGSAFELRASQ